MNACLCHVSSCRCHVSCLCHVSSHLCHVSSCLVPYEPSVLCKMLSVPSQQLSMPCEQLSVLSSSAVKHHNILVTALTCPDIQSALLLLISKLCYGQVVGGERDPDSVLEEAWAQSCRSGQWPLPGSLNRPLHVFQTWLRHLLWELSSLAAQVSVCL